MEWKYCKLSNQLTTVHGKAADTIRPEFIAVVSISPAPSGHWAGIYEMGPHWGVFPTAGKFVKSVREGVEWAESFITNHKEGN